MEISKELANLLEANYISNNMDLQDQFEINLYREIKGQYKKDKIGKRSIINMMECHCGCLWIANQNVCDHDMFESKKIGEIDLNKWRDYEKSATD